MLSKLLDGCKVKRHRKKGSENYSHTNVRGLLILVPFYNLSWEFHPLQSFAHQLRQNDYHAYPFSPDFYPRSQFHNPNCPLDGSTRRSGRDSNFEYAIFDSWLPPSLPPHQLSSGMEINLGY